MAETKARLYKRDTVSKRLEELLERVKLLNADVEGYEFGFYVRKIIVFGSFVSTNNDKIHDLDIGYQLELKPQYAKCNPVELAELRFEDAPLYMQYGDILYKFMWPEQEVLKYLKNKSGIYSLHPLSDEGESKIIMEGKHGVVYDLYSDDAQKELKEYRIRYADEIKKNVEWHNMTDQEKRDSRFSFLLGKYKDDLYDLLGEFLDQISVETDVDRYLYTGDDVKIVANLIMTAADHWNKKAMQFD